LAPELDEPRVAAAIGNFLDGRSDQALAVFNDVFGRKPRLAKWLVRMMSAGIFPSDPALIQAVENAARRNP
jgi:hypothetical protein